MIKLYKDGKFVEEFPSVLEAIEYANADAEIFHNSTITWDEKEDGKATEII